MIILWALGFVTITELKKRKPAEITTNWSHLSIFLMSQTIKDPA